MVSDPGLATCVAIQGYSLIDSLAVRIYILLDLLQVFVFLIPANLTYMKSL